MTDARLIVRIGALSEDSGVLVRHFRAVIDGALGLLKRAAKELAGGQSVKSQFFVVDASHNSPYKIEIACRSEEGAPLLFHADNSNILRKVGGDLHSIEHGKSDDLSGAMMNDVDKFIAPIREKASHRLGLLGLHFVNGKEVMAPFSVTPEFIRQFQQARARDFLCQTAVSGRAEMIDLRGEKKIRMRITCPIGGEVTCFIDKKLREQTKAAIDNMAVMRGMGRYRPNGFHPYQIDVTEEDGIEVFSPDPGAPKLSEFAGAFPGLTRGKSTEDYLREIREED